MIAVLPFSTRRTDAAQGILARQLPARVATVLGNSGVVHEPWFAVQQRRRAHLIVEGPIPTETARTEAARLGATAAIVGSIHHEDGRYTASWTRVEADDGRISSRWAWAGEGAAPESLVHLYRSLATSIAAEAGVAVPALYDGCDDALLAVLYDADTCALHADAGHGADGERTGVWAHLVAAMAADPTWAEPDDTLQRRIHALASAGFDDRAVDAERARAEVRQDVASWLGVARRAEAAQRSETLEVALRRLIALDPRPSRAMLRLGVFLVREGRTREAIGPLGDASKAADCRDVADTYLGVALASLGEMTRAIDMWTRVARDGDDPAIVALATRNLERARPS